MSQSNLLRVGWMMVCCFHLLMAESCGPSHTPEKKIEPAKKDSLSKPSAPTTKSKPDTVKRIYLTFDDGPLKGTEKIIDAFDKEKLPATMFVVGRQVQMSNAMKAKFDLAYHDPYLEVANHSFSHAWRKYAKYYSRPQQVLEDFDRNQDLLHFRDKDARMPGRRFWRVGSRKKDERANGKDAADLLHENGYTIFGWDLEWRHRSRSGQPVQSVQEMFEEIEKAIDNPKLCFTPYHLVLLAHDEMFQKSWEESELHTLISLLRSKNYKFEYMDNYPRN